MDPNPHFSHVLPEISRKRRVRSACRTSAKNSVFGRPTRPRPGLRGFALPKLKAATGCEKCGLTPAASIRSTSWSQGQSPKTASASSDARSLPDRRQENRCSGPSADACRRLSRWRCRPWSRRRSRCRRPAGLLRSCPHRSLRRCGPRTAPSPSLRGRHPVERPFAHRLVPPQLRRLDRELAAVVAEVGPAVGAEHVERALHERLGQAPKLGVEVALRREARLAERAPAQPDLAVAMGVAKAEGWRGSGVVRRVRRSSSMSPSTENTLSTFEVVDPEVGSAPDRGAGAPRRRPRDRGRGQ